MSRSFQMSAEVERGVPDTIPGEVWRVCIRTRDVGMIIWQVANVMNHMPEGNHKGAMDAISLLLCAWNRHPSMEEACKWGCSCRCRRSRQQLCSRLGRWQAPCTWDRLPRQQTKDGRLRLCNISRRWTWSQLDVRSHCEQAQPATHRQRAHSKSNTQEEAERKRQRKRQSGAPTPGAGGGIVRHSWWECSLASLPFCPGSSSIPRRGSRLSLPGVSMPSEQALVLPWLSTASMRRRPTGVHLAIFSRLRALLTACDRPESRAPSDASRQIWTWIHCKIDWAGAFCCERRGFQPRPLCYMCWRQTFTYWRLSKDQGRAQVWAPWEVFSCQAIQSAWCWKAEALRKGGMANGRVPQRHSLAPFSWTTCFEARSKGFMAWAPLESLLMRTRNWWSFGMPEAYSLCCHLGLKTAWLAGSSTRTKMKPPIDKSRTNAGSIGDQVGCRGLQVPLSGRSSWSWVCAL